MISLLNYTGNNLEKVIAKQLSKFCKAYSKLYPGQMSAQKEQSVLDALTMLLHIVQKNWSKKKLARALFIDIEEVFDHISKSQLLTHMIELHIDIDLIA